MADDVRTIERRPTVVAPAETPGLTGLLTLAVAVVVVAGLYLGRTVLIPITLAVLLSFLLAPIVNLLRRIHLGRVLSVLVAVMLALEHHPGARRPDRHPDRRTGAGSAEIRQHDPRQRSTPSRASPPANEPGDAPPGYAPHAPSHRPSRPNPAPVR